MRGSRCSSQPRSRASSEAAGSAGAGANSGCRCVCRDCEGEVSSTKREDDAQGCASAIQAPEEESTTSVGTKRSGAGGRATHRPPRQLEWPRRRELEAVPSPSLPPPRPSRRARSSRPARSRSRSRSRSRLRSSSRRVRKLTLESHAQAPQFRGARCVFLPASRAVSTAAAAS